MKYSVGDKVKIRTWEDMEKKYGLDEKGRIPISDGYFFLKKREDYINKNFPDRIIKIHEANMSGRYFIKGDYFWGWQDWMIECLAKDYKEPIPISNRWEILDL